MSNIVRMLRALPIYVVTGKTEKWSTNAAGYFPVLDTGTRNDSFAAGGALAVTKITDITGLTAWKDYIPVMEATGATAAFSFDDVGYVPVKLSSGTIFIIPEAWNPLDKDADITLSVNNTEAKIANGAGKVGSVRGVTSHAVSSGDWYFEVTVGDSAYELTIGVGQSGAALGNPPGTGSSSWGYYATNGRGYFNGVFGFTGATYTVGDVIGVRLNGTTLTFYKNGASQGSYTISGTVFPMAGNAAGTTTNAKLTINTGGAAFQSLPSGSSAWN